MILINPVTPNRMGMISRYSAVSLPISSGILAGYLISKGKKVKIIDELVDPINEALSNIKDQLKQMDKPYIFGISCLTINIGRALTISKLIKLAYPDGKIILGGIHPTVLPEELLNSGYVDIVVRGEGEETLFLLYEAIKNNKSYADIAGISFRDGGNIRHNSNRSLIEDLDKISKFPYMLFDTKRYNLDFVMTSRGCPFNCIFCSQRQISGRKYRFRSCESVIQELDLLVNKYHQQSISFLDDDFLVNKERVKTLSNSIIRNRLNRKANFGCQTRADNVNEEILKVLKEAGFTFIALGMETGSERLMRLLNKAETVKENIGAVKLIHKMGLNVNALFLFGVPTETKEERFQTYILAKGLRLRYAKFNNVVPYPGTKLFEIAKTEGILNIEENWRNFNSVGGVVEGIFSKTRLPYVPKDNTEIALKRDLIRANLYFYLSNLASLFISKKGNPGWFVLSPKWYLNPREYYHLFKLALKVLINAIIVFDLIWVTKEMLWWLKKEGFDTT